MNQNNMSKMQKVKSAFLFALVGGTIAVVLIVAVIIYYRGQSISSPANRQEIVHLMGQTVMPFDLTKTFHVFQMTDNGGIQKIVAKDGSDKEQIALIRQHLQHEAVNFSSGNYADPQTLHGNNMPGIKELEAGASKVSVQFESLNDGAQIVFATNDQSLITAIHKWFGAQLSDHGTDAMSK